MRESAKKVYWDTDNHLIKYHISSVIRRSFFPFQNNPKNLEPSNKISSDETWGFWSFNEWVDDCSSKVNF